MNSLEVGSNKEMLKKWIIRCHLGVRCHSILSNRFEKYNWIAGVAIIIISASMNIPALVKCTPYLSALLVCLASIQTFSNWGYKSEKHENSSKRYGDMLRKLEFFTSRIELTDEEMHNLKDDYDRVVNESPKINDELFEKQNRIYIENTKKLSTHNGSDIIYNYYEDILTYINVEEYSLLEKKCFGAFSDCPDGVEGFIKKMKDRELVCCEARLENLLLGYCILERINDDLWHCRIISVIEYFRRRGIASRLTMSLCSRLLGKKAKYISLFTRDIECLSKIFKNGADPISKSGPLNTVEKKQLNALEKHRKFNIGYYGNHRTVENYYHLKRGNTISGHYLLLKLSKNSQQG